MTQDKKGPERAVALRYDPQLDDAPRVMAKGSGLIAENIRKLAREHNIPIHEDQELVEYLMALDIYQEIPPEIYPIVAEILAFIYRMNQRYILDEG
ncbi:MAG: EscU/YscU/HrcU family type III secretion system export apparatus switch protein [Syntrophomonadaceae bacterium]|jgi:flagellar biosynthesis protein|nr:EscU/YscU/HrcU family type III secretion system export apparatus switch protein [Bacillota bacterium]NLM87407.1 flagellar biosynthesis protein FlhB [Syntrophomonadaceae bacterium]HAA08398.1 flagellar biosynthesis protein FlhB [Syntrophomonas sp.]HQA49757.1 EscU/YscU/HrcU family type III secretion system export apparatus switch protein [Syntrophomonadaceae bacterium]HQD90144.1 EscU/YscU/HrcU family type III secretion system export apparatus switch protein [Syntrophomonadaceae bacterium]